MHFSTLFVHHAEGATRVREAYSLSLIQVPLVCEKPDLQYLPVLIPQLTVLSRQFLCEVHHYSPDDVVHHHSVKHQQTSQHTASTQSTKIMRVK